MIHNLPDVIVICGLAGTGKTSVASLISKELNYEHLIPGDLIKSEANKLSMTVSDYLRYLLDNPSIDKKFDNLLVAKAMAGQIVIESRILPWLLPETLNVCSVWLKCDYEERIGRVCQ